MLKYNIEVAHIYIDQDHITDEQMNSINILKDLFKEGSVGSVDRKHVSVGIWIDDYNPVENNLDVLRYFQDVQKIISVDYLCSEEKVSMQYDIFRNFLDEKSLNYHDNYFLKKKKLPCSLLTAMWYAIRLGIFEPKFSIFREEQDISKIEFQADRIFNILPKKFANSESKVIKIYKDNSRLMDYAHKIRNVFY